MKFLLKHKMEGREKYIVLENNNFSCRTSADDIGSMT